jgi:hypothetical protein
VDSVRTEIEELHRFFEQWLSGETDDFSRCDRAFASDFTMVGPRGDVRTREIVVRGLQGARGQRRVAIRIENVNVHPLEGGLQLARYQEWQDADGVSQGRISTALFRPRADAPCGVEWVTVHETFLG